MKNGYADRVLKIALKRTRGEADPILPPLTLPQARIDVHAHLAGCEHTRRTKVPIDSLNVLALQETFSQVKYAMPGRYVLVLRRTLPCAVGRRSRLPKDYK